MSISVVGVVNQEHKECEIKCLHCQENRLATDYKCKIIDKYRRELIEELKKHPEQMPLEVQLFIPSGIDQMIAEN